MKRWSSLLVTLLLLPAFSACAPVAEQTQPAEGYGLWFAVESGSRRREQTAVIREERQWDEEPTAAQLMQALLDGPEEEGLYAPFPYGVSVHSITLDAPARTIRVDLSEQYEGLTGFELTVADYCIALTLCQLPQVETVLITVEGKSIPYRDRQELRAGDVLLSSITEEPGTFLAALYFPGAAGGTLVAEYRQVTRADGSDAAAVVLAQLLLGPTDSQRCTPLPEGTRVLSLTVESGTCQVNLSHDFLDNAPQEEEQAGLTLYALVNTLCALSGVSQVQLLVEGETVESYGGVSTAVPLSANFDLISQ